MNDPAAFSEADYRAIYGEIDKCLRCGKPAKDAHHILKRAVPRRLYDIISTKKLRKIMSSTYNLMPSCDGCHKRGDKHYEPIEVGLLHKAMANVDKAVLDGRYRLKEEDRQFRARFQKFYLSPSPFVSSSLSKDVQE